MENGKGKMENEGEGGERGKGGRKGEVSPFSPSPYAWSGYGVGMGRVWSKQGIGKGEIRDR